MLPKASALRGALVARSYVQASTLNISTCSKGGRPPRKRSARGTALSRIRPEKFKIHQTTQPLERVALGRKLLQTLLDIEEPGLAPHPTPRSRSGPPNMIPRSAPGGFWRCGHWGWAADTRPLTLQRSVANAEPASLCRLGRFPGDDHHLPEADRYAANLAFEPEKSITCVSIPAQSGAPRKSGLQTVLAKPRAVIVASIPSSNDEAPQLRFDVPPEDSARRCEMFKPSPTFRPRGGHVHVALTYVNPARKTGVCLPSAGAAVPSSSFRDLFLRRRVTEHLLSGCAPFHLRLISRLQLR